MPKYPISLGKKMGEPSAMTDAPKTTSSEMYYPSLHLDWEKPYDLPKEGTMVVKFKKTSESNTTRNGKTNQSVSLDIIEIVSVDSEEAPEVSEPGDRIDALRKQVEELAEESAEDY